MFWADRLAFELKKRGNELEWVDDAKTPSGKIHVGSLRGVILHDLVYKALIDAGVKTKFTYLFDDHDPMDDIPAYLDKKKYESYLGKPLNRIPPPEPGFNHYAEYYAQDFINVFNQMGAKPEIIWTSSLYNSGKMNEGIRTCLDNVQIIRNIYNETYEKNVAPDWYPFQVVCPNCGRLSTTRVIGWDGKKVSFVCKGNELMKIDGCGLESKISPFNGNGKLSWKVEWAVKWSTMGITVEGAGKDHMTAGGSHDIAQMVCERVLNYPVPYPFAYEFFLVKGKKMSSSKGLGRSAQEIFDILGPHLLRFLMVRADINKAIDFDPQGMTIPDLFDEYDYFAKKYYKKEKKGDFARVWQLSQIGEIPEKKPFFPRFRDVANYLQQPGVDLYKKFGEIKGSQLNKVEKEILGERIKYAKVWLKKYAPAEVVFHAQKEIPEEAKNLSLEQKKYLLAVADLLKQKKWQADDLQKELYQLSKKIDLSSKQAFQAIYLSLIGKTHGPKAALFLLDQDQDFVIQRFKEIQE